MREDSRKSKWPLGTMSFLQKQSLWVAVGNIRGEWQALDVSLSNLRNSREPTLGQSPTHVNPCQPRSYQETDANRKLRRRTLRFLWSLSGPCSVFTTFSSEIISPWSECIWTCLCHSRVEDYMQREENTARCESNVLDGFVMLQERQKQKTSFYNNDI